MYMYIHMICFHFPFIFPFNTLPLSRPVWQYTICFTKKYLTRRYRVGLWTLTSSLVRYVPWHNNIIPSYKPSFVHHPQYNTFLQTLFCSPPSNTNIDEEFVVIILKIILLVPQQPCVGSIVWEVNQNSSHAYTSLVSLIYESNDYWLYHSSTIMWQLV